MNRWLRWSYLSLNCKLRHKETDMKFSSCKMVTNITNGQIRSVESKFPYKIYFGGY